jgi:hypothetical protein
LTPANILDYLVGLILTHFVSNEINIAIKDFRAFCDFALTCA